MRVSWHVCSAHSTNSSQFLKLFPLLPHAVPTCTHLYVYLCMGICQLFSLRPQLSCFLSSANTDTKLQQKKKKKSNANINKFTLPWEQ